MSTDTDHTPTTFPDAASAPLSARAQRGEGTPQHPKDTMTNNVAGAIETVESHLHPTPSFSVEDHPEPTGREEVWRFTPVKRLRGLEGDAPFQASTTECTWNDPAGATIRPVADGELRDWRGVSGYVPTDRAGARIMREVPSSLTIDVPAESEIAEPIRVELDGKDAGTTEAGHIAIRVGHHAKATIVLRHTGSATLAQVVELDAEPSSDVTLIAVQDWADDAVHLATHSIGIGRDAHVRHIAVSLGGDVVRVAVEQRYTAPGGELEAFGLYFVDAGQHIEHRLFVDHNQPKTKSNVDYRGALQGDGAHSVWVGDVLIRKVAEGIETYEANKNLVLTDGCKADSVPNLEIQTGEIVGAGHSSTTGRFDDNQLFYLCSRGIPEDEARRLVVYGFFTDIIRRIGVPELEEQLTAAIEHELSTSVGAAPAAVASGAPGAPSSAPAEGGPHPAAQASSPAATDAPLSGDDDPKLPGTQGASLTEDVSGAAHDAATPSERVAVASDASSERAKRVDE